MYNNDENETERAILIGIGSSPAMKEPSSPFWVEFAELARTAGAEVVDLLIQTRDHPDPALFIGTGKAEELVRLVIDDKADLVISAQELTPAQARNLSDKVGVRVIDRTGLILDIFAQRAQTREGKLQVELAQLNYLLPRLGNSGTRFSRLGGGIGTRGPGETKLEVDRRRVRERIADLQHELITMESQRSVQRQLREKNQIATVAMVGYTNAGKSTLFNQLTTAGVPANDRLFDTLDPISRMLKLPNNKQILLLDTVGFINDLPHQLVAAFKATLEETVRSGVLLVVMDASSPNLMEQYMAVRSVLSELRIKDKETINVLNKIDLLDSINTVKRLAKEWEAVPVSAKTGEGLEELVAAIQVKLAGGLTVCRMLIPFNEAGLLDLLHRKSLIKEEEFTDEGVKLLVELETSLAQKYRQFVLDEGFKC